MPQRFHVNEIADKIITLINDNLAAGMGLVTIAKGGVEFYMADQNMTVEVPAVFVKPIAAEIKLAAVHYQYEMAHRFRIVYVRKADIANAEKIVEKKVAEALKIAELLIDKADLDNLALSNGQIVLTVPSSIEWEPEEDALLAVLSRDLVAAAFTFDVVVKTRRS